MRAQQRGRILIEQGCHGTGNTRRVTLSARLRQGLLLLHRHTIIHRVRGHSLNATQPRGRNNAARSPRRKETARSQRLTLAGRRERTVILSSSPIRTRLSLRVAGNQNRAGAQRIRLRQSLQRLQRRQVIMIGQQSASRVSGYPAQLIHFTLISQGAGTIGQLSSPVENILRTATHRVGRHRQGHAQNNLQANLFANLANSGLRQGLARILLALRPGPVIVAGAVNNQDLKRTIAHAPNQCARSNNIRSVCGGAVNAVDRIKTSCRVVDGGGIQRCHISL